MRRHLIPCLIVAAFFSGCAYQGVLVEKRSRPVPFSASLGVDAMYNFQLRDNGGQVHSQMVTDEVFASYRVGDYFDDLQAPPARDEKESKRFRVAPPELYEGPYQPVRVMQIQAPTRPGLGVAAHVTHRATSGAKTVRTHRSVKHTSRIAHHKKKKKTNVAGKRRAHRHQKADVS